MSLEEPIDTRPGGLLPDPLVLGVVVVGLLLSISVALVRKADNAAQVQRQLSAAAEAQVSRLQQRMQRYEYGLRGARGAIVSAGTDRVTRGDFARYHATRELAVEFPGAHGFGFVRHVQPGQRGAVIARARAEGVRNFQIHPVDAAPVAADAVQYVIDYIEPVDRNRQALGLDIASEPRRRHAAERAMRTGLATLTEPITLVQASGKADRGFLVLLPIYRQGAPVATATQREAAVLGWSYAPLVYDEVVGSLADRGQLLALTVSDLAADAAGEAFYRSAGHEAALATGLQVSIDRPLYGRDWRYTVLAGPGFVASLNLISPWGMAVVGLGLTLLAAALVHQRQVSQRRAAQVHSARLRLASVVENASDAIISESLDGRVTGWNRAAEQIFGWRVEEVLGRSLHELIGQPMDQGTNAEVLALARQGQVLPPFDTVRRRRDGLVLEVSIAASPIRDAQGHVIGVGKSLRDVSQRRQLERDLKALTESLEQQVRERTAELESAHRDLWLILDALPSLVGYWDQALINRFANRAFRQWYGFADRSITGMHIRDVLPPKAMAAQWPAVERALAGESQVYLRDAEPVGGGGLRHLQVHLLPDTLDGQTRGFYVLTHDVTELTESQRRLSASEAFLERAGQVARVGGWEYMLDDGTIVWTRQTRLIHEVGADFQPTLETAMGFFPRPARQQLQAAVDAAVHRGESWDVELPLVTARGRQIWVRTVGEPEFSGEGAERHAVRLIGAVQDITARRGADEAVRRLEAAEAANAAKSIFLANVSHEMRTPLNAIIGFGHLLHRGPLQPAQREQLSRVQQASQALLGTINDVLDLSKIEAGQMAIVAEPFSLQHLLTDLRGLMLPSAQPKGLTLGLQGVDEAPDWVVGDGLRLRQMLTNLLANAIKFTERGGVTLSVRWRVAAADDGPSGSATPTGRTLGQLELSVADTGIGIEPEALKRLFEPFSQADASTTRRFGGTGLGLSIVRRLAVLMGGEVQVHSVVGEGSRFSLSLPMRLADAGERQRPPGASGRLDVGWRWLPGMRVMVVDDSELNREVVSQVLSEEGAQVLALPDGAAALAQLAATPDAFDALLLDLQMPGMDGLEVARRLRANAALRELPVIALTAGALVTDRERAMAAGMDDFVAKPFEPARLVHVLRALGAARRGADWPKSARGPSAVGVAPVPAPPPLPGLDLAPALERLHGDAGLLSRLLDRLADEGEQQPWLALPRNADEAAALAGGQADPLVWTPTRLARLLHRLRGSAGIVGATAVAEACRAAESLWREAAQALPPSTDVADVAQADARRLRFEALIGLRLALDGLTAQAPHWRAWASACEAAAPPADPVRAAGDGGAGTRAPALPLVLQGEDLQQGLHRLANLVRQRDLAALAQFKSLQPSLQSHGAGLDLLRLDQAFAALDFAAVETLLEPAMAAKPGPTDWV